MVVPGSLPWRSAGGSAGAGAAPAGQPGPSRTAGHGRALHGTVSGLPGMGDFLISNQSPCGGKVEVYKGVPC